MSVRTSAASRSDASAGKKRPVCGAYGSGDASTTSSSHSPRTSAAPPLPSPALVPGGFYGLNKASRLLAHAQRQPRRASAPSGVSK